MGATLAYELYYRIADNNLKEPLHIFFSGSKPPRTRLEHEKTAMLDDDQFLERMSKYGGFSEDMLGIKRFRKLYLPLLRADCCVLEDYKFEYRKTKIKCSISVMYGKEDLSYEEVKGWSQLADSCVYEEFEGGHFYIDDNVDKFSSYIKRKVNELSLNG